jgi:hypothetical protein
MRAGLARRLAVVGLAIVLALGANIVCVAVLSLGVERWGEPTLRGLAVGILAAGAALLQRSRRAC